MGGCCAREKEKSNDTLKEPLENYQRYKAICLPSKDGDCIGVYDFSDRYTQILRPNLVYSYAEYGFVCKFPLVYLVGGVSLETGRVSSSVWSTSISEGFLVFDEIGKMNIERKKPSVLCPRAETLYVIGGFGADGSQLRSCEKYLEGTNIWEPIDSLELDPLNVFGLSRYIYVFERLLDNALIQRMCCDRDSYGWGQIRLKLGPEVSRNVEGLENFNISVTNNEDILIFGGVLLGKAKSNSIFKLDPQSGKLIQYPKSFVYPNAFSQSSSDSQNRTYYITTNYRLLIYSKHSGSWSIQTTDIIEKSKKKGYNISI